MKQLISSRLSFYFFIFLCFAGTFINLEALNYAAVTEQEGISDIDILDMYTTLRVIRGVHDDVQDQLSHDDQLEQSDFIVDIMIVLVGMYEKIVGATATYYLMAYLPVQQSLHEIVGKIIANGVIEIMSILSRQLIRYIFNQDMTLREKIWYCAWAISIIGLIKVGIDQIPQSIKPELCSDGLFHPTSEQDMYNLPNPIYDLNQIRDNKSSYLRVKGDD